MAALGILAVGTGLQIYGQYKDSKARSKAARQQADIDELRATELLQRNDINNSLLAQEGAKAAGSVRARSQGSADTIGALSNLARDVAKQMELNTRDAEFEASMIRLGAESSREQAKDIRRAGNIQAAGTLLGAGAQFI